MRPFVVHASDVPEVESRYPAPFDAEGLTFGRNLGEAAGAERLGTWVERLPPGRRTSRTHAHLREEELVYVLEGTPVLRWIPPGGHAHEEALRPGSFVAFPAATGIAHALHNPGPGEARLLVVGERRGDERVTYPEDADLEAWRLIHRPLRAWGDVRTRHPDARPPAWRIRTRRVEVRPWALTDTMGMVAVIQANQDHLKRWMSWAVPVPSLDETADRILQFHGAFARGDDHVYGLFINGTPVGGAGLHPRVGPRAFEIGYWITAEHEGKGLVSEVVAALTRVAFLVHGVDRVEIRMDPENVRSAAVPRRLGYTHEGTLTRRIAGPDGLRDAMVWALSREQEPTLGDVQVDAWDRLERRIL